MLRSLRLHVASLLLGGSIAACGNSNDETSRTAGQRSELAQGYGRVVLGLTTTGTIDAGSSTGNGNGNGGGPVVAGTDLTEIVVDIDEVTAHVAGTGWVSLMRDAVVTVDLLKLQDKVGELGFADVPPGKVTQIRLHVVEGSAPYVTTPDGTQHPLETPSGMQSGLKLRGQWHVETCASTHLTIAFDKKSIHVVKTGHQDRYVLRPVIRLGRMQQDALACSDVAPPNTPASGDPNDPNVGVPSDPNDTNDVPSGSTDPNGTTDPNDPNGTTDPNDPNGTTDPNDPNGTTDPNDPNGTTDPNDPNGTTDPNDPNGTTDPNGSSTTDPSGSNDQPNDGSSTSGTNDPTGTPSGSNDTTNASGSPGVDPQTGLPTVSTCATTADCAGDFFCSLSGYCAPQF